MVVDLDQILIADHQQAVPLKMLDKVVVDGIFVEVMPLDEQLGIEFVLDHRSPSSLQIVLF